jgi:hypothetical protein
VTYSCEVQTEEAGVVAASDSLGDLAVHFDGHVGVRGLSAGVGVHGEMSK